MKNSILLLLCLATAGIIAMVSWKHDSHVDSGYVTPKTSPRHEAIPSQNVLTPGDQTVAPTPAQAPAEALSQSQSQSQAQAQARANADVEPASEHPASTEPVPYIVLTPPAPGSRAQSLREWLAGAPDESTITAMTRAKYATEADRTADLVTVHQAYTQHLITLHEYEILRSSIIDLP